ncbi:MAG TPA: DegT/DnrJ/EryC1/StrS family aminotransferase [Methanomicrobiales archaeon]|nr:DegT/DnrJ/EryC1/StrS family aminotransferase [Methanomicrobiales archaeon]
MTRDSSEGSPKAPASRNREMIPVCVPLLGRKELEYVTDCVRSNWISSKGRYVDEFEKGFARYCGVTDGIATTNGTAALHLALAALGVKKGDEVILPAFTMMSTAFAVLYCGATPVLVDAEPGTWNMDATAVGEKVTDRTRVILPVHIYGHPCDMEPILEIAEDHDLRVVEDAAEAHGALCRGRKAGGIGDCGCFSFYANKIITTGEGGMVVTGDPGIAERARSLKDLAFQKDRRFLHTELGFNYRMTNIEAAIGLAQLDRIDEFVEMRRAHAALYNRLLKGVPGIQFPVERSWARNVYWMYSIVVTNEFGMSRETLMDGLATRGIETRTFFVPVHEQPVCTGMGLFAGEHYPVAEDIGRRGLYLPSGSGLTNDEIAYVCTAIREIQESRG